MIHCMSSVSLGLLMTTIYFLVEHWTGQGVTFEKDIKTEEERSMPSTPLISGCACIMQHLGWKWWLELACCHGRLAMSVKPAPIVCVEAGLCHQHITAEMRDHSDSNCSVTIHVCYLFRFLPLEMDLSLNNLTFSEFVVANLFENRNRRLFDRKAGNSDGCSCSSRFNYPSHSPKQAK